MTLNCSSVVGSNCRNYSCKHQQHHPVWDRPGQDYGEVRSRASHSSRDPPNTAVCRPALPFTPMRPHALSSLLVCSFATLMSSIFMPMCRANGTWPTSIKKEFTGALHKFLAQLVETSNSIEGRTVLYIPEEDVDDPEVYSLLICSAAVSV